MKKPKINVQMNIGCHVMNPEALSFITNNKTYVMDDIIKKAMSKRKLVHILSNKDFIDIGNKTSYRKSNEEYKQKLGKI